MKCNFLLQKRWGWIHWSCYFIHFIIKILKFFTLNQLSFIFTRFYFAKHTSHQVPQISLPPTLILNSIPICLTSDPICYDHICKVIWSRQMVICVYFLFILLCVDSFTFLTHFNLLWLIRISWSPVRYKSSVTLQLLRIVPSLIINVKYF